MERRVTFLTNHARPVPSEFSIGQILPTLLAIASGMFLVILDSTVMNVAIPKLVDHFGTTLGTIQWVITAYTLALAAVIPLAGWFSDRFGAKKVFLSSIVLFVISSVLCTLAQTPEQLIVYRIIQGLGGGMVAPIGIATTFRIAPPEKRGSIMGILGIPMLLAPILGPILSGSLIEYVNWHWIFIINVPVGMLAFFMAFKFLPATNPSKEMKLDAKGALLAPIAFASLVFSIHQGGDKGWSDGPALASLALGAAALLLFIVVELRQKQPLMELRVFRSLPFFHGAILAWLNQIALFGSLLLFPLYLQQIKGLSPFEAGLYVIPQAVMSTIGINIGGKLFDKYGTRPVVIVGISSLSGALLALTQISAQTGSVYLLISFAFVGLGQGLTLMQINSHILKLAPRELVSRVTPITTSAQQIMSSFGITITTAYLSRKLKHLSADASADLGIAFGHTFWITAGAAGLALLVSLFLQKEKQL
ncbi:putative transport protein HsrA [compost metagenome]